MEITIKNLNELNTFTKILANFTLTRNRNIFLLNGDLGSGKTTFVRYFVMHIPDGKEAEVSSPSFNLYNIYPTRPETIHIDLYRCLELEEEILEFFRLEESIIFIEWCERLPKKYWPDEYFYLDFKIENDEKRLITLDVVGFRASELIEQLEKNLKEQGLS